MLGLSSGHLEVFDIPNGVKSHTQVLREGEDINDIVAIDDTQYLLATNEGLMKTTKEKLVKHYYQGKRVRSLCHLSDSLYVVGFNDKLIVWSEH